MSPLSLILFAGCSQLWPSRAGLPHHVYVSPDASLQLVAYQLPMYFGMPGGGSDHMAAIELQDRAGKVLARSSSSPDDQVMYRDVEVRWEADWVWYGVARRLPLPSPIPLPALDTKLLVLPIDEVTEELAEQQLSASAEQLERVRSVFHLQEGYPRVLSSEGIVGLPMERYFVVLGACTVERDLPDAYFRLAQAEVERVHWDAPEPSCPELVAP